MNTDIRLSPTLGPSGYKSPPFLTGTKKLIEKEKEEEKRETQLTTVMQIS